MEIGEKDLGRLCPAPPAWLLFIFSSSAPQWVLFRIFIDIMFGVVCDRRTYKRVWTPSFCYNQGFMLSCPLTLGLHEVINSFSLTLYTLFSSAEHDNMLASLLSPQTPTHFRCWKSCLLFNFGFLMGSKMHGFDVNPALFPCND